MGVTCDPRERASFLSALDLPGLEGVLRRLPERRVPKGHTVFHEGERCEGFWIVKDGSVRVQRVSIDGRVHILETSGPGEAFGLVAAIDGREFAASAVAREKSRLLFFARADLLAAIRKAPALGFFVASALAERLRDLEGHAASVALQDVRGRVAALLAAEAEERGVRRADGAIDLRLRAHQEEIARRIGSVREVVARVFRSLREDGVIEQRREFVRVRDLGALRRAAET